ncbi:uncharacterized protein OCT59_023050 [Rhizophagus irregularis]|uniref:uncharacterized protein n=1 Tax=Rhizophagus irregularis TaxID=588596 RepID=UPI003319C0EA|nr:hypothetical protein OCT59_023050 [Rhizophagus irregularis]
MGFLHSKRQNRLNISIEKSEKLYKKNHIATPIQPYKTSDSEENGYSDIEEYNDNDIIQVSDKDDTHLSNETGPNFIAVDRTIHSADDLLAKWNLYSIFNNSLEPPVFVNAMINLDSN